MCREVRNLLTHNPDMNGHPVVDPAPALLETLRGRLRGWRSPRRCWSMRRRRRRFGDVAGGAYADGDGGDGSAGFSHIPIISRARFRVVFSVSTLFSYQLNYPHETLKLRSSTIRDFKEFTPIYNHTCERFML